MKDELRACCSKELRKTLFDFVGSSVIDAFTEDQLLEKIRETAVIGKNKAVHRKEFYEIVQAPDELLNRFVTFNFLVEQGPPGRPQGRVSIDG